MVVSTVLLVEDVVLVDEVELIVRLELVDELLVELDDVLELVVVDELEEEMVVVLDVVVLPASGPPSCRRSCGRWLAAVPSRETYGAPSEASLRTAVV